MIVCPDCGYDNIPGTDHCEQCQQPLSSLGSLEPVSPIERNIAKDRIELLGPKKPLSVTPDTSVSQVLSILVDHAIGCVIVEENDELLGIFSERDALFRLNVDAAQLGDRPISDFMTPSPETLQLTDKIAFALHQMDLGGYRHIPILSEGKAVGIISIRDILRYMTDRLVAAESH